MKTAKRVKVLVNTTDNRTTESDWADVTQENMDSIVKVIKSFKDMTYFMLEVGGKQIYFNPSHIVDITIEHNTGDS